MFYVYLSRMKKLFLSLALGFLLLVGSAQSHSIPPEVLQFLAENPDATQVEFDAFLESSGMQNTGMEWAESEANQSFSLPEVLINYLLQNPEAKNQEILDFIEAQPELEDSDLFEKVEQLFAGETDARTFTTNDLVLLNELSQTFDEVYNEPQAVNFWQFAKNYITFGIEHILVGLDHILFVLALVLLLPPWRRVLALVTTFTIAHSVTLLLGGTQILTISESIVEPIIAASIAYMAITTVFLSKKYPWFANQHNSLLVIFLFGLFHGLGFAGVFQNYAPDPNMLIWSLLFFNIGVEIGQLIILAFFLPLLWVVYKLKFNTWFVPFFATVISGLALWWVVVRILF